MATGRDGAKRASWLRRHAVSLTLVALAAGAGALVLVDQGAVSTKEARDRKQNLFEAWREDEVTEVTLVSRGRTTRFVRSAQGDAGPSGNPWSVEIDGRSYVADQQAVDLYLGKLHFATPERRINAAQANDQASFHLDAPRTTITVKMGKLAHRLVLGGPAPTPPGSVYGAVWSGGAGDLASGSAGGEPRLVVVSAELAAALDASPDTFRSRSFVPYFSVDLRGLHLDGEGGARHLERAPWHGGRGAGFRFDGSTPEGKVRVNALELDAILTSLGMLQAESFLSDEDARRAASARVTVTMIPRDAAKPRGVIELGGACPTNADHVIAVRREPNPAAACVPKAILESLAVPVERLVDRRLVGAALDEITEIKLTEGDRKLEMARAGAGWHLRAPGDRQIPADVGRDFVERILAIEAMRFDPGSPAGLTPPRGELRVVSTIPGAVTENSDRVETIRIGRAEGDIVHLQRVEDGAIATIPAAAASLLAPDDLALRPRRVFDVEARRFRSLRIERDGIVQRVARTESGGWRLIEPKGEGLNADIGLCSDVADLMSALAVERWVAGNDDGSFGLTRPRITIEAEVEGDPAGDAGAEPTSRTLRLLLGAPTERGSFARRDGDPGVFVAPGQIESAASRWLLDRTALRVDLSTVRRVTLIGPAPAKKKLVVVRDQSIWKLDGEAASDPAAATRAAAVRDTLNGLLADGAASIGEPLEREGLDEPRLTVVIDRDGGAPVRLLVGAGDSLWGTSIHYVRREGIAATYAVAQSKIRTLLEAL